MMASTTLHQMLATVVDAVDAAAAAVERVVALSVAKAEAVVVDVAVETVATLEERLAVVHVAPLSTPTTPVLSQRSVLKRL